MKINNRLTEDELLEAEIRRKVAISGNPKAGIDVPPEDEEDVDWGTENDTDWGSDEEDDEPTSWANRFGNEGGLYDMPNMAGVPGLNQPAGKSDEDKIFDALKTACGGLKTFFVGLIKELRAVNDVVAMRWGRTMIVVNGVLSVLFVVLGLFGIRNAWEMLVGSMLGAAAGVVIFAFAYDFSSKHGSKASSAAVNDEFVDLDDEGVEDEDTDVLAGGVEKDDPFMDSEAMSYAEAEEDYGDEGYPLSDSEDENIEDEEDSLNVESVLGNFPGSDDDDEVMADNAKPDVAISNAGVSNAGVSNAGVSNAVVSLSSTDALIDSIDIDRNTVTRSYLVEMYSKLLPTQTPDFSAVEEVSDTNSLFLQLNAFCIKAGVAAAAKKELEEYPCLLSMQEKCLYTLLKVKRIAGLNFDNFIKELTQLLRYDPESSSFDESLYISAAAVGDAWVLKVFSDKNVAVTIKDMYGVPEVKQWVLDTKNDMPVVMGIDIEGKSVYKDLSKMDSLLIVGPPRSGKTWTALSLITQFAMYKKPSELEFYIIDPKGSGSDFIDFMPPHVKGFASEHSAIISLLKRMLTKEAERRKALFATQNIKKIQDWNAVNPMNPCPYTYIYVDEAVTLAEQMEKEVKQEFQSCLTTIITQLPFLGIRAILVPHVIKDQIIKKTTTDNMPCRMTVRGDSKLIEATTGATPQNFSLQLKNLGDMAVRFNNDPVTYIHSAIITPSVAENTAFLVFLRKLWEKLEPESVKTSYYYKTHRNEYIGDLRGGKISEGNITPKENKSLVEPPKGLNERVTTWVIPDTKKSDSLDDELASEDLVSLDKAGVFGSDEDGMVSEEDDELFEGMLDEGEDEDEDEED